MSAILPFWSPFKSVFKGNLQSKIKLSSHEKAWKMQKNEPLPTSMHQMVLEIFHFKVRNFSNMDAPFCRFLASFSLKYDVTDAMLQDIEKMKVQYLMNLLFDILQAVRSEQVNFAWLLNFIAMATQKKIICLYSNTKDYCFLTKKVYHPFFFKTWYYLQ